MRSSTHLQRFRTPLLWMAGLRTILGIVAIPLAPFLYRDHFAVLVLLRPTKEVLLAGGFLVRQGDVNPVVVVVAATPLSIFGVWLFYGLGRAFSEELTSGEGLPSFVERLLPTKRIEQLCRVLQKKGRPVVFIGRLASFPSTLLGAAAGTSGMAARKFLPTDLAGGLLAIAEVMVAGYLLGEAYKEAGPWLAGVGAVLLIALLVGVGRAIKKQAAED